MYKNDLVRDYLNELEIGTTFNSKQLWDKIPGVDNSYIVALCSIWTGNGYLKRIDVATYVILSKIPGRKIIPPVPFEIRLSRFERDFSDLWKRSKFWDDIPDNDIARVADIIIKHGGIDLHEQIVRGFK